MPPEMNDAFLLVYVVALLAVIAACLYSLGRLQRRKAFLCWAARQGFTVLDYRQPFLTEVTPLPLVASKAQQIFYFTIQCPEGNKKSGWVLLGSAWGGLVSDESQATMGRMITQDNLKHSAETVHPRSSERPFPLLAFVPLIWRHYCMRVAAAFLTMFSSLGSASARPEDIPWQPSPDKFNEVAVRFVPSHDGSSKTAKLLLRTAKTQEPTAMVALDVDANDERNGVSVDWSPDSRSVAVSIQVGQLRSFFVYRVASGHLTPMHELPLAKELQSEHTKSRGGPAFNEWLDARMFNVFDSSSETELTYRITKNGELQAIAVKATNP